jgi:hypothetical protein
VSRKDQGNRGDEQVAAVPEEKAPPRAGFLTVDAANESLGAHYRAFAEIGYEFINADSDAERLRLWDLLCTRVEKRVHEKAEAEHRRGVADGHSSGRDEERARVTEIVRRRREELGHVNVVVQCLDENIAVIGL